MAQKLPSAYVGGHNLRPHYDTELAHKGWLYCVSCKREIHGSTRAGGKWDRCPKATKEEVIHVLPR